MHGVNLSIITLRLFELFTIKGVKCFKYLGAETVLRSDENKTLTHHMTG